MKSLVEVILAISMSNQRKSPSKGSKAVGVLLIASLGLIVVGIVAVLLPPLKTTRSNSLNSGQDLDIPIPVIQGDGLNAELTVTSGDLHVYLFTSVNFVKYQGGTYIYSYYIFGSGDFSTIDLAGDTYHLVVVHESGSPATGILNYYRSRY